MALSAGKKFENNIRDSVDEGIMYYRLKDSAQSFEKTARFTLKNPCDFFLYSYPLLLPLEAKTTNKDYFTVELSKEDSNKMIHYHQIEGLREFAKYKGIVPGFILNYRIKEGTPEYTELTYFIHIKDFDKMMNELKKKSFSLLDLLKYNPIKIESTKKRTNFKYGIGSFLHEIKEKYNID